MPKDEKNDKDISDMVEEEEEFLEFDDEKRIRVKKDEWRGYALKALEEIDTELNGIHKEINNFNDEISRIDKRYNKLEKKVIKNSVYIPIIVSIIVSIVVPMALGVI